MNILDYGKWTIAHNVNDTSQDYVRIYKGHLTPAAQDLIDLGGPVFNITNGKTVKKFGDKYDCPDYIRAYDGLASCSTLTTEPFMLRPYLDMRL